MKPEFIIQAAKAGKKTLSEYEAKKLLVAYGIPVVKEELAATLEQAVKMAGAIGYPVAMKACSADVTHKTEKKLLELNVSGPEQAEQVYKDLIERAGGPVDGILVQQMASGQRELVVGLVRDKVFGPCVMFGLGGIYTELLKDVSFRVAPLEKRDALEMMEEIKAAGLLGNFRNMPAVDKDKLADILIAVGNIGLECEEVREIDVNPLIITDDGPVAVDALVALKTE